jgi:DNA invertase Pin-like site-specific DNA recombinase
MMGRYFNEHFMHAKTWPRRGRDDLKQELMERRRRKTNQSIEETFKKPAETVALKPTKGTGGRPKLDIAVSEVLDSLSKGTTVAQTARAMGISRAAVYRTIHSSPEAMALWAD